MNKLNKIMSVFFVLVLFLPLFVVAQETDTPYVYSETVVLASGEWSPYVSEYLEYEGIVSRIVSEAFALEGVKVEFVYLPWEESMEKARTGEYYGTLPWLKNDERTEDFYFSRPISRENVVFFYKSDRDFDWNTISDLSEYRIGGTKGYFYGADFDLAEKDGRITIERVESDKENFERLVAGEIDILISELNVGYGIIHDSFSQEAEDFTYHQKSISSSPLYLLLSKQLPENEHLIELFDNGLTSLEEAGVIENYWAEFHRGELKKYAKSVKNRTIKSASEYDFPPFAIVIDDGEADGFSVELLTAVLNEEGYNVSFYIDEWPVIKEDLAEGRIDVLPTMIRSLERELLYEFTVPYLTFKGVIYVRTNDFRINSIEDLSDKKLVVMKGDSSEDFARSEMLSSNIITTATFKEAFELLSKGKVDALLTHKITGNQLLDILEIDNVHSLPIHITNFQKSTSFAVKKGDKEMLAILNEGLSQVISDGTYDEIYDKWFREILDEKDLVEKVKFEYAQLAIKQKAEDVAKQIEIYIMSNPDMTIEELQNDSYFQEIAVQQVGETGYTLVGDTIDFIVLFHKDFRFINFDMHNFEKVNPELWKIVQGISLGVDSEGFHIFEEADGTIKEKYSYMAIVDVELNDGSIFFVAATTYLDEYDVIETVIEARSGQIELSFVYIFLLLIVIIVILFFLFSSFKKGYPELQLNLRLMFTSSLILIISYNIEIFTQSELIAFYFNKIIHVFAYFIIFFLMLVVFNLTKSKIKKSDYKLLYLLSIITSLLILFTNLVVKNAVYEPTKYFFIKTNPGVGIYGFVALLSLYLLTQTITSVRNYLKHKTKDSRLILLNSIFILILIMFNIIYYFVLDYQNPIFVLLSIIVFILFIGYMFIKMNLIEFEKNTIMMLLGFSLFLVILVFVFNTYQHTQNMKEEKIEYTINTLYSIANLRKDFVDYYLKEQRDKIQISATHQELTNEELKKIRDSNREFYELFVLDSNGIIISASDESIIGSDKSTDSYFINARDKTYIKPIYYSNTMEEIQLSVSTPFKDGVLVAKLNVEPFIEIFEGSIGLGESGESLVAYRNQEGDAEFFSQRRFEGVEGAEYIIPKEHLEIPITQALLGKEEVFLDYNDYRNVTVIAVTGYIEEWDIGIVTKIDEEEVIAQVLVSTNKLWIFTTGIIIIIIIIGINTTFLLTKSLKQNIDEKTKELTELNLNLEEKVKERTKQLRQHEDELNIVVERRTKELNKKIKEQEETKAATFNILDDVEESRGNLEIAQKELKKTIKELEIMDRKRDEFISITAHELKTPLTSIHGFSDLLQNPAIANDEEKRNSFLKIIGEDTDRLSKLVTDILDLSRMDIGTMKFDKIDLNVKDFVEKVKRQLDILIKNKKVNSKYNVEDNLPSLFIDESRLMQIITNFITNAIKYTQEGDMIMIDARRDGENIRIAVTDNGKGIPKEEHDKIFERFYQVDSSYTRKAGGSGLGLAISKELTEAMGGEIHLESEGGKGSTFSVIFPIKK